MFKANPMFDSSIKTLRGVLLPLILVCLFMGGTAFAQHAETGAPPEAAAAHGADDHAADGHGAGEHAKGEKGEHAAGGHGGAHEKPGTFDPHFGTWLNPIVRLFSGEPAPQFDHGHITNIRSIRYDYVFLALLIMAGVGALMSIGAKKAKIRPEGKPGSLPNMVEAAADGFREYLIGIMGPALAMKYAPLVSSFFFTILFMNWMGLVPGMMAPTANPNIPISLAIVAFFSVHFIAIKETGVKSWFMHFVGEPLWLAPLNLPLHLIGELIKPLSLAMRLLCNVFGEEMVITTLTLLAVSVLPIWLPIPFQIPMLFLGSFFGFLQALVFSTLLAIYIAILATHHDDHDEHNDHGHVEHAHVHGHHEYIAHPSETPVA